TYEVHFTATVSGKYHIYGQKVEGDGPVPTSFNFAKNPLIALQGVTKEQGKKITKFEEVWGFKVNYFENKVDFVQVVKSKVNAPTSLKGSVEYMVCDDKQCLPPKTVQFDVKLGN
ncbi:MAG: protein-disulfide reductase DsbD domain-containing protein, partial [Bacteroidota bacterium]